MGMDLSKIIKKYKGLWVSFKPETNIVVSSGKNLRQVVDAAKKKGIEIPSVFKVPTKNIPYVGQQ